MCRVRMNPWRDSKDPSGVFEPIRPAKRTARIWKVSSSSAHADS